MQMTLLFITVWFSHFLIVSALYFNTSSDYTETTQITTTTNQEREILITATHSPPLNTTTQDITTNSPTEVNTWLNITPNVTFKQKTTSWHQHTSSRSQNDMMGDDVNISNTSDVTKSRTNTTNNHTTVSTNFARHEDDRNETGTTPNLSYNEDGHTVQTPDPFKSVSTDSWMEEEDETTKSDEVIYETNSTQATFANMNTGSVTQHIDDKNETGTMSNVSYNEHGHTVQTPHPSKSVSTNSWMVEEDETMKSDEEDYETNSTQATFANMNIRRVTPHMDDKNITGMMSNASYSKDGHTVQTPDPFNSISTASWKDDETSKTEGNYETNSTQPTFANTKVGTGTGATGGSYNFTSKHSEEHYERTVNAFNLSATEKNNWSTLQTSDIPMITSTNTISQDPTVAESHHHTSTDGGNHSTTQQNNNRFTSSVTLSENITGTDTPNGTNINNNTTSVSTDNITNTTSDKNKTDTENKEWPTCFNSESRQSRLVCFITIWTLAMTATIFLGITIFLWVRLSVFKKKMKEKGGHLGNKESLWADPKATVQERVEFWYVNGSTLEADRKDKNRKRQERMKGRGQEQNEENELWIQPRVTVDDITEFWYANRRRNETIQDMY